MAVDPKYAAELDAIDQQAKAAQTAANNAVTAAQAASTGAAQVLARSAALRAALDTTGPPPTSTPISIVHPVAADRTVTRVDSTTVAVPYTLAGTLSRALKLAVAVVGGTWQEYLAPTSASGTISVKVPGTAAGQFHFHVWDAGLKGGAGDWVIALSVPFPQSTVSPPDPPNPPDPGAPGLIGFGTDAAGQPIFTIDGKPTVLVGLNGSGQHGYWGGGLKAAGHSDSLRGWGNFLRLFEQEPGGGECDFCPDAGNPETTAQVIAEYTGKGLVVMLDYHQFDFGSELTPAHTAQAVAWWRTMAQQFKGNGRVIFEACNEPEATFHSYNHGATDETTARAMMVDRWVAFGKAIIDAIRGTGAENVIVFDDAQAGQGCDDFWQIGPSQGSAIIAAGRQLVAYDPLHRVAFSVHTYDAFGWGGPGEQNNQCEPRYTDAQRDARLLDYVRRVYQATGRPLIAGEFGWQNGESATTGTGFHYPYTQCGSRTLRAQQATTRIGGVASLSTAQWIGFQLTTNGNNGFDPTPANLTACGQDYMAYCNRMRNGPIATAGVSSVVELNAMHARLEGPPEQKPAELTELQRFQLARPNRMTDPEWADTTRGKW